jgi:RNA polymerase sigma-70 factor (ECF subfamily)
MRERLTRRSASAGPATPDFEALVGPWVAEMYRLAAAIVGVDSAEDVTQDALVDAWRGLPRLRDRTKARAWLHSIVVNRASKHLRARRSRPRLISVAVEESRVHGGRDPATDVARRDSLDRAFEDLSPDQRACVVLHYSFDFTVPQIAATLGVPDGTVKSRIHAGIQRLRAALAEDDQ